MRLYSKGKREEARTLLQRLETIVCRQCKQSFEIKAQRGRKPNYCSDKCREIDNLDHQRAKDYGLSVEAIRALKKSQGDVCAICTERPAEHLDHDHNTNQVRAFLCSRCNMGLGQFFDRPDLLRQAANYLEQHTLSLAA